MTEERSNAGSTAGPILDLYAPLNYKAAMSRDPGPKWRPATWVPAEDQRRLTAYQVLEALAKNNSRAYRKELSERQGSREYGDGDALVEAIAAAIIGDSQVVSVKDAEVYDPEFDPQAEGVTERMRERQQAAEAAHERQEMLDGWAEDENLLIRIPAAEKKAVKLGDGVYTLIWSDEKRRPVLKTYDPGFYFPRFSDWDEEFPSKVHLAWETETEDPTGKRANIRKVRRITFELRPIQMVDLPNPDGKVLARTYPQGVVMVDGVPTMQLPWNDVARGGEPARPAKRLCYMSDGIWEIDVTKNNLDDFEPDRAEWNTTDAGAQIRDLCLNIDFIPVIHIPNTEDDDDEHFGASALLRIAQLLDDLIKADTDIVDAAATSAFPITAFEGGEGPETDEDGKIVGSWGPGSYVYNPNGKVQMLSTADALQPLATLVDRLLERASVNARVPASALGRDTGDGTESGIHLALSWGPLRALVSQSRLSRKSKYRLLLKFTQRYFQLAKMIEPGPENILSAEVVFGAFLPTDRSNAIKEVIELFKGGLVSLRTALSMLIELGVPIDDAEEELKRIRAEDFEGANALLDATGDQAAANKWLGLPPPEEPETPAPVPPGQPGGPVPTPGTPPPPAQPGQEPPPEPPTF